jgi:hypothetical protein
MKAETIKVKGGYLVKANGKVHAKHATKAKAVEHVKLLSTDNKKPSK